MEKGWEGQRTSDAGRPQRGLLTPGPASCGCHRRTGRRGAVHRVAATRGDAWGHSEAANAALNRRQRRRRGLCPTLFASFFYFFISRLPGLVLPTLDVNLPELDVAVVAGRGQYSAVRGQGTFTDSLETHKCTHGYFVHSCDLPALRSENEESMDFRIIGLHATRSGFSCCFDYHRCWIERKKITLTQCVNTFSQSQL